MDKPKFYANERVDSEDVAFLTDTVLGDFRRHMRGFVVGDSALRVLDGFAKTILVDDTTLRITLGKALAAEGVNAIVTSGQILSEGVASQDLAFAALGAATYGVWIKFQYADGVNANRKFYDVNTDTEKPRNVKARSVAGWAAKISVTSPGAEWMQIYSVIWNAVGLGTSTINDTRAFLFEGKANASPAFGSDWGAGNDRNNDRASFGVKTLERFAAAVLKKIEELQSGSARWWTAPAVPLDGKVSKAGDTMTGDLQIVGGHNIIVSGDADITGGVFSDQVVWISNSDASGAAPIWNSLTHNSVILQNVDTSAGNYNNIFFAHMDGGGNADGVAIYSKKQGDNDVDLIIGKFTNSGAVVDEIIFDSDLNALVPAVTGKFFGTSALRWSITGHTAAFDSTCAATSFLPQDDPAAGDPITNALTKPNTPKAWARIKLFNSGAVTLLDGVNISAVGNEGNAAGGIFSISLNTDFAGVDYTAVSVVETTEDNQTWNSGWASPISELAGFTPVRTNGKATFVLKNDAGIFNYSGAGWATFGKGVIIEVNFFGRQ